MASEETLRVVTDLSPETAITRWLAGLGVERRSRPKRATASSTTLKDRA